MSVYTSVTLPDKWGEWQFLTMLQAYANILMSILIDVWAVIM